MLAGHETSTHDYVRPPSSILPIRNDVIVESSGLERFDSESPLSRKHAHHKVYGGATVESERRQGSRRYIYRSVRIHRPRIKQRKVCAPSVRLRRITPKRAVPTRSCRLKFPARRVRILRLLADNCFAPPGLPSSNGLEGSIATIPTLRVLLDQASQHCSIDNSQSTSLL